MERPSAIRELLTNGTSHTDTLEGRELGLESGTLKMEPL